ncbi:very low-density lipoprotein receptor-like [Mya arenaria]|uniref:very low-density lipoprotein receptor-like n=1 Tax=Mya arenaria TaxID=6604 RepID=UPI0022E14FD6|nr:very low-density lipoprotein receptor-like [Mya arenaria]
MDFKLSYLQLAVLAGCILLFIPVQGRHRGETRSRCAFYRENYMRLMQNFGRCSEKFVCRKLPEDRTCELQCIPKSQRCDGSPQCPLQDDEETCPTICEPGSLLCPSGKCAPVCDGPAQCDGQGDGNDDERKCPCPMNKIRCPSGQCAVKCDGNPECDASLDMAIDEQNCPCLPGQTRCLNGTCVAPCNTDSECQNGEDEAMCTCPSGFFTCSDKSCVRPCDQNPECADQSDEDPNMCYGGICRLNAVNDGCSIFSNEAAICFGDGSGACNPLRGLVKRQNKDVCLCVSSGNDIGPDVCRRLGYRCVW